MTNKLTSIRVPLCLAAIVASAGIVPAPTIAHAQQDTTQTVVQPPPQGVAEQPPRPGAAVVVRGDTLFTIYGTLGPFTPRERARALSQRIDSLAEDALARAASVNMVDSLGVTDILVGDFVIMTVTERDAAESGLPRAELGQQYATQIQNAIRTREGAATIKSILIGLLFTLVAVAGLVLIFRMLNFLFPVIYRRLEAWRGTRIPSIKIQRLELLSSERLTDVLIGVAKVLRVAAVVVVLYIFVPLVLSFFPWTRGLSRRIVEYVANPLRQAGTSFINYLPDLFTIAVIVVVIYYILKFIHLFFTGIERGAIAFPGFFQEWSQPTYKIVRFLVIVFGLIVVYPYLPGSDTAAFKGISVFVGVIISFGSSSAIANVVAGVVMTYMRPFQLGDRVKIADTIGDIVEKTLLVTRVRTVKNVDITIPNAMVLSSHIINFSSTAEEGGVILHTGVTIGYDVPWRTVHELLVAAAEATEGLLDKPKPFVLQTSLDDFYVSYELNVYSDKPNAMAKTYSELHQHIQDRFNEAGVEILSPHYRAARDGNQVTIPQDYLPQDYEAPSFRIKQIGVPTPKAPTGSVS